ncbi:hypothetical protein [Staphylococcus equorum]|uniref:Uncharacterized protein n=1 Tax=Staphylococcus equorum TaxID=246432 RepID=A0A9X4LBH0_9STAP|nr:hypothetical protein [Staphylococcus equorum]MDG0860392.1 hypothetical protein [Staphylococcus equorum]
MKKPNKLKIIDGTLEINELDQKDYETNFETIYSEFVQNVPRLSLKEIDGDLRITINTNTIHALLLYSEDE